MSAQVTGTPSTADVEAANSKFAAPMLQSLPKFEKKNMAKLMTQQAPGPPADAIDIVEKLLEFNPAKRLTVEQALEHPYMKAFRTGDEARCPGILSIPIDDDHKFTVSDYREKLYHQASPA